MFPVNSKGINEIETFSYFTFHVDAKALLSSYLGMGQEYFSMEAIKLGYIKGHWMQNLPGLEGSSVSTGYKCKIYNLLDS